MAANEKNNYELSEVFGCSEVPADDCPTFIDRDVHIRFRNALKQYNIIVVYGESRQGKTWMIRRCCPDQIRIGCMPDMTVDYLKVEMLRSLGMRIGSVQETVSGSISGSAEIQFGDKEEGHISGGLSAGASRGMERSTSYDAVDLQNLGDVIANIRKRSRGRVFVIDNFHQLSPDVQFRFSSLLPEFSRNDIKMIITGIWKDEERITVMAPDLVGRCEHIHIGSWTRSEFEKVLQLGDDALNIRIGDRARESFIRYAAGNIGIFKEFLQRYCREFDVNETVPKRRRLLQDDEHAAAAVDPVVRQAVLTLDRRLEYLAKPQVIRKTTKFLRLKLVIAILRLICNNPEEVTRNGIQLNLIVEKADQLCESLGIEPIRKSNLIQELGHIHDREGIMHWKAGYTPLFYYDKLNHKLLVLEPTIYMIKAYKVSQLQSIADNLEFYLKDNMPDQDI